VIRERAAGSCTAWVSGPVCAETSQQGRRDSNPRPTVLETAALPTELRPWVARENSSRGLCDPIPRMNQRRALGALFLVLAIGFAGVAFAAAYGAGRELAGWAIVLASAALAVWLGSMAFRALR
jgi:hypothetical protein